MSAGYFINGFAQGVQMDMQWQLSKNNMALYSKQIDMQEENMRMNKELNAENIAGKRLSNFKDLTTLNAYNKQQGLPEITMEQLNDPTFKMPSVGTGATTGTGTGLDANQVKTNFDTLYNNLKGNVSFLFDPKQSKKWGEDYSVLTKYATQITPEGKTVLSNEEISKVKELKDNAYALAYLQKADSYKIDDNKAGMTSLLSNLEKDKKNMTVDQYNQVKKTLKGETGGVSAEQYETQTALGVKIKTFGLKDAKYTATDLYNTVNEIDTLYKQGKVSKSWWSDNKKTVAVMAIKKDMIDNEVAPGVATKGIPILGWNKKTFNSVAQAQLTAVGSVIPDNKKNSNIAWNNRYDLNMVITNALAEKGIDGTNTDPVQVNASKPIINSAVTGYVLENYSEFMTDEQKNKAQKYILPEADIQVIVAKANSKANAYVVKGSNTLNSVKVTTGDW